MIVGSAIVRRIAKATTENVSAADVIKDVGEFSASMLAAIND